MFASPFSGEYLHTKQRGTYSCVVCGGHLFLSNDKFESGCGWPAFSQVLSNAAVNLIQDYSHGLNTHTAHYDSLLSSLISLSRSRGRSRQKYLGVVPPGPLQIQAQCPAGWSIRRGDPPQLTTVSAFLRILIVTERSFMHLYDAIL